MRQVTEPRGEPQARSVPQSAGRIAALVVHALPRGILHAAFDLATAALLARHPEVGVRLAPFAGAMVLIEPVDLPFALAMRMGAAPAVRLAGAADRRRADAVIAGPVLELAALLEGRVDGDALFFSRTISVRGDTGLVVALRNALDGAQIDAVGDLCAVVGPAAPFARRAAAAALHDLLRLGSVLDRLSGALPHPRRAARDGVPDAPGQVGD